MTSIAVFAAIAAAALPVDVTTLSGGPHAGALLRLDAKELSLRPESGPEQTISHADLLEIRCRIEKPAKTDGEAPLLRVWLVDGSRLHLADVKTTAKELRGRHALLGDVVLPLSAIGSVRFTPSAAKFDPLWTQLAEKGTKSDMIVVQKAEVLDHLDGVVGAIDDAAIKFLLDGDEISVKREKAFGIIYARKPSTVKLAGLVELSDGDSLAVKGVAGDGETWQLDAAAGPSWRVGVAAVAAVDFRVAKLVYLSTLEPRAVKYTPFIQFKDEAEFYWKFRRDRSLEGKPLRLGQKTYASGLALHSRTELKYRLGGEFRRFQTMLGIDDEITNTNWGAATVRILGDRKELFVGECRPRQPAVPLDLDVTNVVELDILVDFGPDKSDIGDRVHLADARLVK